jgi:hypothetical protein
MPSLYEMLDNAHDGEGMAALGREFGLTPTREPCCHRSGAKLLRSKFEYPEEDVTGTRGGAPLGTDAERIFWKGRIARNARPLGRRRPRRYPGPDIRAAGCRDHPARLQARLSNFLLRRANRLLFRQTRAGSLLLRAISSVRFYESLRREFEMAASNRSLSAGDLYRYPCRANNKVRCPPVPTPHGCRAATSLAKSYAMCLAEPWGAPPKCRKGDRDSHRR